MATGSIFSLKVVRCPACAARLPVASGETLVVCEYCDARVQIGRRADVSPSPKRHVASPHYSPFAWVIVAFAIVTGLGAVVMFATGSSSSSPPSSSAPARTQPAPVPVPVPEPEPAPAPAPEPEPEPEPTPVAEPDPTPPAARPKTPSRPRPKPSGPLLSVAQAKAALEPKVLACMREAKIHSLLAYMGNKDIGAVKVLADSRTRIDGRVTKVVGTKLGRCMDAAGATVNTRANKSNTVRLALTNAAVPDPLAKLPATHDRKVVQSTIAARHGDIEACAAKHGQVGVREVFYFQIDGPAGDVMSVRGTYASKAFRKCAEAIYRKLEFPRVRENSYKYTHSIPSL